MKDVILAGLALPFAVAEARSALLERARRTMGATPSELLVDHVLRVSRGADLPVHEAALDALQRRWSFARKDELVVDTRPERGLLGPYTTGRAKESPGPRPYATVLATMDPLVASCDCADFLRSSLGICKHVLVVLDDVFARPGGALQAHEESAAFLLHPRRTPRLSWDPVLPLGGELDRLMGLRLEMPAAGLPLPEALAAAELAKHWARARRGIAHGVIESVRLDPERRRELLASLEAIASAIEVTPSARALVAEETVRVTRALANGSGLAAALASLEGLKRRLYPYQREGVERFLAEGRLLLADDMGLGKTTQAIAACHALFAAGRVRRGLVIAPATLKSQWLREWSETTDVPITLVDGGPEERAAAYRGLERGFLILGYEQLLRDAGLVKAIAAEVVVLDEAQRIKNYATKSAIYVKSLQPEYRLVLTGTPMENRLEELASVLDWVDDVALSPKWRLVPWYTTSAGDGGEGRAGARNLDTLRTRLHRSVVRRVRRDVLAQLPARTDTRVPVEMTEAQLDAHGELDRPIAALASPGRKRPLTHSEFLRLMQLLTQQRMIANGLGQVRFEELWPTYQNARPDPALLEGLFAPKLLELRRLLEDLVVGQGRKVIVFSQWRRMLRLAEWSVRDILERAGFQAVFFTGAETSSLRTRSIVDFHEDDRIRAMFLSDAGGVGLNLQKAASACINLELPWNPAVLEQRIGRIYRLGQERPIDVYNLVSERSIEGRIAGLLGAKQALFNGLFDGTTDEISFDEADASFMGRVALLVDPAAPTPLEDATPVTDEGVKDIALLDASLSDELPVESAVATPPMTPDAMRSLLGTLRIERTVEGGIRIEAPPETAGPLLTLMEGLAKLFAEAGNAKPPRG